MRRVVTSLPPRRSSPCRNLSADRRPQRVSFVVVPEPVHDAEQSSLGTLLGACRRPAGPYTRNGAPGSRASLRLLTWTPRRLLLSLSTFADHRTTLIRTAVNDPVLLRKAIEKPP
jgi:hypothetical protein